MNREKVLAGVITYNPELGRFRENIVALNIQLKDLIIVDNGSDNFEYIKAVLEEKFYGELFIIQNPYNFGIAKALFQIMEYASGKDYEWVLSLDQDSVIQPGLVERYILRVEDSVCQDAAMFTCLIQDRNFRDEKYEKQECDTLEVPYCITSAAFTNVKKYMETSGYDVDFFIDCVDFDICYSLREQGYKIYRINYFGLIHEVGRGENRYFLWKKIVVYHHNPCRIFYLARNTIKMNRKHPQLFSFGTMLKKLLFLFIRIVLYENNKEEKIKNYFSGIRKSLL